MTIAILNDDKRAELDNIVKIFNSARDTLALEIQSLMEEWESEISSKSDGWK